MRGTVKRKFAPREGTPAGRKILAGLGEIAEALERGDESRLTAQTVELGEPGAYGAAAVKAMRDRLGASQRVFARLLGVRRCWSSPGSKAPAAPRGLPAACSTR